MTTNPTDIVAYTFQGANYHPQCLIEVVAGNNVLHEFWLKAGVEAMLTAEARTNAINREDETTFDSDDFPKVVLLDQVVEGECCFRCGEDLIESASNPWKHATERN